MYVRDEWIHIPLNTDIVFVPGVILNLHNVRGHRDEWIHTRTFKYRYSFCSWCYLEFAQCTWTQR